MSRFKAYKPVCTRNEATFILQLLLRILASTPIRHDAFCSAV